MEILPARAFGRGLELYGIRYEFGYNTGGNVVLIGGAASGNMRVKLPILWHTVSDILVDKIDNPWYAS